MSIDQVNELIKSTMPDAVAPFQPNNVAIDRPQMERPPIVMAEVTPEIVHARPGPGNTTLVYVPGKEVLNKFIELTNGQFSWEIQSQDVKGNEQLGWRVVTIGKLTFQGFTKSGVGEETIKETQGGGEIANEAFKASETDAFKRAAEKFGLYLQLSIKIQPNQVAKLKQLLQDPSIINNPKVGETTFNTIAKAVWTQFPTVEKIGSERIQAYTAFYYIKFLSQYSSKEV